MVIIFWHMASLLPSHMCMFWNWILYEVLCVFVYWCFGLNEVFKFYLRLFQISGNMIWFLFSWSPSELAHFYGIWFLEGNLDLLFTLYLFYVLLYTWYAILLGSSCLKCYSAIIGKISLLNNIWSNMLYNLTLHLSLLIS